MIVGTAVGATTGTAIQDAFDQVQFKGVSFRKTPLNFRILFRVVRGKADLLVFRDSNCYRITGHDVACIDQSTV